jgi:hypothetical protein
MNVIILKVKGKKNLAELADGIRDGHTLTGTSPDPGHGGWQMPKTARPGDLAIWYAGAPDQRYVAYGVVAGIPRKPSSERVKYYGPVADIRPLPAGPQPRKSVAAKSGVNGTTVAQLAQTVPAERAAAFLKALGL